MQTDETNKLARISGEYPPPQVTPEQVSTDPEIVSGMPQQMTFSDRIDDLIGKSATILIALGLTAIKLTGLAFLFWAAFALYPDDFLSIPFAQMTFGHVLSFLGSCLLALLGISLVLLWRNLRREKS